MKVRVNYTADVSDVYRCAVRAYYGKPGLASREELKQWFERYGSSMDDEIFRHYNTPISDDGDASPPPEADADDGWAPEGYHRNLTAELIREPAGPAAPQPKEG